MYCPGVDFEIYKPYKLIAPWYIKFLLKFKPPFYLSDPITEYTTNYLVYKWLFGSLYMVDEYACTTFGMTIEFDGE